ncbi:MAG: NUDIX domain-containing protein [Candidatus Nanopelagicales bacterium]
MTAMEYELADQPHEFPVVARHPRFHGKIWDIVSDEVDINGQVVTRDVLRHTGAVAIAALDVAGRLLLIRQYRHPVAAYLWEIPAGLLDIAGEDPLVAAQRELAEEAGVVAEHWELLIKLALSPGGMDERIQIYRATGLQVDAGNRVHTGEAEELDLPQKWVPLSEAVSAVLAGNITNATAASAILALAAVQNRQQG